MLVDPAYPLTTYCLEEYQSCSSNDEVLFNIMLRAARNPVECAFGRLKARWSILTRKIDFKLESVPILIYACFVLHNLCKFECCHLDETLVRMQIERNKAGEEKLKKILDPVCSYNNGEDEFVLSIPASYINDNLPDDLV